MGHYLSEMENDGIPASWKLHQYEKCKPKKYSSLHQVCMRRAVEATLGVALTWEEVIIYLDALKERRRELRPFEQALHEAERQLSADIVAKIRANGGSNV